MGCDYVATGAGRTHAPMRPYLDTDYVVTRSRSYQKKPIPSAKGFFIHDRRVGEGRAGKAGHGIYTIVI